VKCGEDGVEDKTQAIPVLLMDGRPASQGCGSFDAERLMYVTLAGHFALVAAHPGDKMCPLHGVQAAISRSQDVTAQVKLDTSCQPVHVSQLNRPRRGPYRGRPEGRVLLREAERRILEHPDIVR
jgi:hypothetical protein